MPLLYHWRRKNYVADADVGPFDYTLHQRSARLHEIEPGESLWAFTRNARDEYVLACELVITEKYRRNTDYGSYGVRGDPERSRYFDIDASPSVEPTIRQIVDVPTEVLGSSFQGGGAVRVVSAEDDQRLRVFARPIPVIEAVATRKGRNPPWTRDELILALDLYMRQRPRSPSDTDSEVIDLSKLLNQLGAQRGAWRETDYRNPNGVSMKMLNFRRLDPYYTSDGRVGLQRGAALDEVIWNEYAARPDELRATAQMIRDAVDAELAVPVAQEEPEGLEGGVRTTLHRRRERDSDIPRRKKAQVLATKGKLECEVCRFDFVTRYGARGQGFIECHHVNPLALREMRSPTNLADLALVCSNCHRMIHAQQPWLSVDELRAILR